MKEMKASELKAHRQGKKMTQQAYGDWLCCSKHAVISWENERNPIPDWVAQRVRSDRPTLNPVLSLEDFQRAQDAARKKGRSLEDWIADLIKSPLLVTLLTVGSRHAADYPTPQVIEA